MAFPDANEALFVNFNSSELPFSYPHLATFAAALHENFSLAIDASKGGMGSLQVCDFKIKGSYFDRSCAFYLGDSTTLIAQMNRQYSASTVLLGRDIFGVTVFPQVDYVFIAALVVILDDIHRDKAGE